MIRNNNRRSFLIKLLVICNLCFLLNITLWAGQIIVNMPEKEISIVKENGYAMFTGADLQCLVETGEPAIPYRVYKVLLPPDTDMKTVKISLIGSNLEQVPGIWKIKPMPPPATWVDGKQIVLWPEGKEIMNGKNMETYNRDMYFPGKLVNHISVGKMRKWKLVNIPIAQFQYNPATKVLKRLISTDITIDYEKGEGLSEIELSDKIGEDRLKRLVINYNQVVPQYRQGIMKTSSASTQNNGYVILTTQTIVNNSTKLDSFIKCKELRGLTVHVVTENAWGGDTGDKAADNIRDWLQENYISYQIEYLLLIGDPNPDSGDVPMKRLWPTRNPTAYEAPSDYFYADLSGDWDLDGDTYFGEWPDDCGSGGIDREYEIVVGRIPYYGSISDLDDILTKTIAYEKSNTSEINWRKKVLLPMKPSDDDTPGYQLGEEIKDYVLEPKNWNYHRVYDENYSLSPPPETVPCTLANVKSAWNGSNYGAVFWWTHGNEYLAADVMDLTNAATLDDSHPVFTFQSSCSNSYPEYTSNLTYSLLKNGAVNAIGATRVSWYYVGQTEFWYWQDSNSGMNYEYSKRLISNEEESGYALHNLKQLISPIYYSVTWMNFCVFNIYGDPSLSLFSQYDFIPPESGDWIITQNNTFVGSANAMANVIVTNNAVLTISDGATLNIDLNNYYLKVKDGSGVLIEDGGKIF
ncbi:C25 family cysteine peptidase [Candidatus Margulisiibacteriota bacterium]